jgi:hypothetical protein
MWGHVLQYETVLHTPWNEVLRYFSTSCIWLWHSWSSVSSRYKLIHLPPLPFD